MPAELVPEAALHINNYGFIAPKVQDQHQRDLRFFFHQLLEATLLRPHSHYHLNHSCDAFWEAISPNQDRICTVLKTGPTKPPG